MLVRMCRRGRVCVYDIRDLRPYGSIRLKPSLIETMVWTLKKQSVLSPAAMSIERNSYRRVFLYASCLEEQSNESWNKKRRYSKHTFLAVFSMDVDHGTLQKLGKENTCFWEDLLQKITADQMGWDDQQRKTTELSPKWPRCKTQWRENFVSLDAFAEWRMTGR